MKPRAIYRVLPDAGGWKLVTPTRRQHFTKKADAVWHGRRAARARWENGQPAQLVIHKRNGQIQKGGESTYGHDPKRYES